MMGQSIIYKKITLGQRKIDIDRGLHIYIRTAINYH